MITMLAIAFWQSSFRETNSTPTPVMSVRVGDDCRGWYTTFKLLYSLKFVHVDFPLQFSPQTFKRVEIWEWMYSMLGFMILTPCQKQAGFGLKYPGA